MKKFMSVLLSALLITSVICSAPFAVSSATEDSVTVGETSGTTGDCTWTLDDEGTLTISGNGAMGNYARYIDDYWEPRYEFTNTPWGKNIKRVIIEFGVTNIGNGAFCRCSSLESVTIPDSVTSIGSFAFSNCENLASVKMSDSITSIGNSAFSVCRSLESISIPSSVTIIDSGAFVLCDSLHSIHISDIASWCKIRYILAYDSMGSYFDTFTYAYDLYLNNELITNLVIPDDVTSISNYAFYLCKSISRVTIPDSVYRIGDSAFSYCKSLSNITIGDGVKNIGKNAFAYCGTIDILSVPDSFFDTFNRVDVFSGNEIQNEFFYDQQDDETITIIRHSGKQKDIVIPDNLFGKQISLKNWLFAYNSEIESVVIPDTVTTIPKGAFYNCVELKTVTMGNNVKEICANAFEKCLYLESINLSDDLQTIGDEAFYDCRRLKKLDIPGSVTSIGGEAFTNCRSLTDITIPEGVNKLGEEGSVGYGMFENCQSLAEITIPKSVDYIQSNAFDGCKNLTIIGASGSYAKSYAENNRIPFRAISSEMAVGDTNGDNVVDILDATVIQKYTVDKAILSNEQKKAADVNDDGVVNVLDALDIQKFAVDKIKEFKK